MPQSLARILVHLIFGTKDRAAVLAPDVRPDLRAYCVGILTNLECPCLEVGGMADHMHVLFAMHRTRSVAEVVEEVKKGSSKWLKTRAAALRNFGWQNGYAAFSVSPSSAGPRHPVHSRPGPAPQTHHLRGGVSRVPPATWRGVRREVRVGLISSRPFRAQQKKRNKRVGRPHDPGRCPGLLRLSPSG